MHLGYGYEDTEEVTSAVPAEQFDFAAYGIRQTVPDIAECNGLQIGLAGIVQIADIEPFAVMSYDDHIFGAGNPGFHKDCAMA